MPIVLSKNFEKGWDYNNKHETNDPIFVVTFIDEKTGKPLFKYGAKLTDINFWIEYFAQLGEYEHKKLREQVAKRNSMENIGCSSSETLCKKET